MSTTTDALIAYAKRIREQRRANPDSTEPALAPTFQRLLAELMPHVRPGDPPTVLPEYENPGVGRPDIALQRPGQPARAFVELKASDKPADPTKWKGAHDKRQFARFASLPHWAGCNFTDIARLERGKVMAEARIVPPKALDPDMGDAKAAKLIEGTDPAPLLAIVTALAISDPPPAPNAEALAANLAHSARLMKAIIADRLEELRAVGVEDSPLQLVRKDFRDVLYAHPEAGGYTKGTFDELFAAAFAQTLAFGLLLVREASGQPVTTAAWEAMPDQHPLMKAALRALSQQEIEREMGLGFTVMIDTVNSFDPAILAFEEGGRDPILFFYEDFLEVFDPAARERYGVYYTPIEVVRYMVGALDRALRDELGTDGLTDDAVTILDPATGTGTFLIAVAERVRAQVTAAAGAGSAELALRGLAERMFGLELLIGPYAVAHYRLHHALAAKRKEGEPPPPPLPRLGVYLADTLSEPSTDEPPMMQMGMIGKPISQEREAADTLKATKPILAIIGNPPYRRLEAGETDTLVGHWMNGVWDDLKAPVSAAGWGNQLNTFPELSVAFWRWALWKLFEADNAPKKGAIAFITNRTFLAGKPYAGLRKMMRERFDLIEIIDLRGDVRRGERAGVANDQGVFNIQVGTAITLAIADGSKAEGALAEVRYTDSWERDLFSKGAKLAWLEEGADAGERPGAVEVKRELLEPFRPKPFQAVEGTPISSIFVFRSSGVQTKRDSFLIRASKGVLTEQLTSFHKSADDVFSRTFNSTTAKPLSAARAQPVEIAKIVDYAYRPLDTRVIYNHRGFIDRPRPELQAAWGDDNVGLYAMPFATGAGPAVWCHGLLPDYHAFRGSYGGYAFPLYDRREGPDASNLSPDLLAALTAAYGTPVPAEDAFDAILGLLSATSYTLRFAEDLEDTFPHVPFPADPAVFARAVAVGRDVRAVETFARAPAEVFRTARLETAPTGPLAAGDWDEGAVALCADGSGRITGVPAAVWAFAVSGYRVLPRWLAARAGLPVDKALDEQVRDLVARIAELLDLFDGADSVLDDTLAQTLTREELGLADAEPEEADE